MNWCDILQYIAPALWIGGFIAWLYAVHNLGRARRVYLDRLIECLTLIDVCHKIRADEKKDNECPK